MRFLDMLYHKKRTAEKRSSRLYLKLRSHFMLTFVLVVLIPFGAFGLLSYNNFRVDMQENVAAVAAENINQLSSTTGYILEDMRQYSEMLLRNIEASDAFKQEILESSNPSEKKIKNLKEYLDKFLSISLNTHIPVVNIYLVRDTGLYTIYSTQKRNPVLDSDIFKGEHENPADAAGEAKLAGTNMRFYDDGSYTYVISFIKPAKASNNADSIPGSFLVDIDYKAISTIISTMKSRTFSGSEVYLVDGSGKLMYCSNPALLTTELDESIYSKFEKASADFFTYKMDGKDALMSSRIIPSYGWQVISTVPINESLKFTFFMKNYFMLLLAVCAVAIFAFSFMIKLIILNPINDLSAAVSPYDNSSYSPGTNTARDASVQADSHDAGSPSNIQSLIHRVYSTKLEQKETQLKSLQSQINPHFLYNTLESIRGSAIYHGIPGIAEMSRCLSSLFRYSIGNEILVPVRSEIQNIEEYMSIQNFRHDNKFDLTYNISEKLYDYKILKLTLQPIIENSIKHGLETKLGKGRIKLSIMSLDNTLRIEVSDDGLGITPEKIRELNRKLSEGAYPEQNIPSHNRDMAENMPASPGTGIGAQNVNSRIKLYFGDQYGVRYKECDAGATVEIILPSITDQYQLNNK